MAVWTLAELVSLSAVIVNAGQHRTLEIIVLHVLAISLDAIIVVQLAYRKTRNSRRSSRGTVDGKDGFETYGERMRLRAVVPLLLILAFAAPALLDAGTLFGINSGHNNSGCNGSRRCATSRKLLSYSVIVQDSESWRSTFKTVAEYTMGTMFSLAQVPQIVLTLRRGAVDGVSVLTFIFLIVMAACQCVSVSLYPGFDTSGLGRYVLPRFISGLIVSLMAAVMLSLQFAFVTLRAKKRLTAQRSGIITDGFRVRVDALDDSDLSGDVSDMEEEEPHRLNAPIQDDQQQQHFLYQSLN